MEELEQLRARLEATRSVAKASLRSLRTTIAFLADLEERLGTAETQLLQLQTTRSAQSKEAQRDDQQHR